MTIEELIRKKEDLEIRILNFVNEQVGDFQEETKLEIRSVEIIPYKFEGNNPNFPAFLGGHRFSDVNVIVHLQDRNEF
jgi:hypothetical protein